MLSLLIFFVIVGIVVPIFYQYNHDPRRMPKVKKIIGYKKVYVFDRYGDYVRAVIATLEIPRGSQRYQYIGRIDGRKYLEAKCRTSEAKVLSLKTLYADEDVLEATSCHDRSFKYRVGETVYPTNGFALTDETCDSGIHFYMRKRDAERH